MTRKKIGALALGIPLLAAGVYWFTAEPPEPEGPTAAADQVAAERKRLINEMPGTYQESATPERDYVPIAVLREEERLRKEMPGTYKPSAAWVDLEAANREAAARALKANPPAGNGGK